MLYILVDIIILTGEIKADHGGPFPRPIKRCAFPFVRRELARNLG